MKNRIFHTEYQTIITKSKLGDQTQLPIFDNSPIFFLETLGEGGSGIVRKAYDKIKNEFIAVKEFKKMLGEANNESKCLEGIMLEDALLQTVEKIRMTNSEYNQHLLKYDGVFRDGEC